MGEQVVARFTGLQLSWLERTPDKREVGGSSPLKPIGVKADEECGTTHFATELLNRVQAHYTDKIKYIYECKHSKCIQFSLCVVP